MSTILLIIVVPLLVSIVANFLSDPLKKRILSAALSISSSFRNYWQFSDDMAQFLQGSAVRCIAYFGSMILTAIVGSMLTIASLIMFSTMRLVRDLNPAKFITLEVAYYGCAILSVTMMLVTTMHIYHSVFIGRKIYRAITFGARDE